MRDFIVIYVFRGIDSQGIQNHKIENGEIKMSKDYFKTNDRVICPYCGNEAGHSYYINVHGWKDLHECGECGDQFILKAKVVYDILVEKVEFREGQTVRLKDEALKNITDDLVSCNKVCGFKIEKVLDDALILEYGLLSVNKKDVYFGENDYDIV